MHLKPWKKLSSAEILKHPRIHLLEDTVELPDGKTTTYLRRASATAHSVALIVINTRQEILLQKEYSYPPDKIMWQLPGGKMKAGEGIPQAANRELSEESGFIAAHCKLIGQFYMDNRRSDEKQYVVLATSITPRTGKADPEEFIETHWIPISKLRPMIAAGAFENVNLLAALNIWFSLEEGESRNPSRPVESQSDDTMSL